MKDQLSESISAVMDSQADDLEVRRLLKTLDSASEEEAAAILAQWESFHTIGSVLRDESISRDQVNNGQPKIRASADFAARVSAAIADEVVADSTHHPVAKNDPVWRRFAVAASVTLAVLVGVQEYESMQEAQQGAASYTADSTDVAPAMNKNNFDRNAVDLSGVQLALSASKEAMSETMSEAEKLEAVKAQERLNEYLLEHTNHAAKQSGQGMIPFARLANFEDEK